MEKRGICEIVYFRIVVFLNVCIHVCVLRRTGLCRESVLFVFLGVLWEFYISVDDADADDSVRRSGETNKCVNC